MHVVFDNDDVLADFWKTVLPVMNQEYGTNLSKDDLTDYTRFTEKFGISHEEFLDFVVCHDLLSELQPHNYMRTILNLYHDQGHHVTVITSRGFHPNAYEVTEEWLKRNRFKYHDIHVSTHGTKKSDYVDVADIVYDDHHKHIEDYLNSGVVKHERNAFIVDQPWNRDYNRKGVRRMDAYTGISWSN